MMVLMMEMVLMIIPMMPGVMAMTMSTIPPPPGGKFPDRFLPAGALLLSVWFPPRGGGGKIPLRCPPRFLGQGSIIRRRGAGEGPQGPGAGPTHGLGWTRGSGSPLPPVARLFTPFWLRDSFPEIICSEFSCNFWGFRSQVS